MARGLNKLLGEVGQQPRSDDPVAPPESVSPVRSGWSRAAERDVWRLLALLTAVFVTWFVFDELTSGVFLTPRNLSNLSVQGVVTAMVALGVGGLLVARQIDLSVGAVVGVVVVITVYLQVTYDWSASAAIAAGLALGVLIGVIQGLLVTKLRLPSFVVTLAAFSYLRGAAFAITGGVTLTGTSDQFVWIANGTLSREVTLVIGVCVAVAALAGWSRRPFGRGTDRQRWSVRPVDVVQGIAAAACVGVCLWTYLNYRGLPVPVLLLGLAALSALFVLRATPFGRHIYAIGGNPVAAARAGIRVQRVTVILFAASAFMAALAGVVNASRLDAGPPDTGSLLVLDGISAAVLGGVNLFGGSGSVAGILLGSVLLVSIQNGLNLLQISAFWQQIVSGLILLVVVGIDAIAQYRTKAE